MIKLIIFVSKTAKYTQLFGVFAVVPKPKAQKRNQDMFKHKGAFIKIDFLRNPYFSAIYCSMFNAFIIYVTFL